jgi:hypothetical protein
MAEVAASAIALSQVAFSIVQKVRGFLQRMKVSDQSAQELFQRLEYARHLGNCVGIVVSKGEALGSGALGMNSESDPWSCVHDALKLFQQYLIKLDRELGDLSSASNPTGLGRALLQWRRECRNDVIKELMEELHHQTANMNTALSCVNM